jgi:hypothetical protein
MYWLKPKNVPIDLITLLILLVFNIIFAKTLHRISLKKMLNRRVSRYFKRYQKYKLFKNTPTKPKPVSHSPITTVPTPTTPTIGSKNSNNSNNTFSEESIKKEIEAMNDEELEKKIKEQKKTLRKQIETARKNAFKTRKRTEIEKTEKTIKDILDKFNLTEDMLNEE